MKIMKLSFIIVLTLMLNSFLLAQSPKMNYHPLSNSILLSLEGGGNLSFSDYESSDIGISFGGGLEYFFPTDGPNAFGLKLSMAQQKFSGNLNNLGLPDIFDTEARRISASFLYSYKISKEILPFVNFGFSYHWLAFDSENIQSRFLDIVNGGEKKTISYDGLLGLKYKVSDEFDLNIGVGYHYSSNDNIDAIKYGDYNDFYLSGIIGVSFRLWHNRDSDGDGISDDIDKCPTQQEDIDGYEDEDGCPDPDNDGDGIIDIKDGCQNIAEDIDGFQDDDGCPDLDNDGDGINDIEDSCPDIAEDFDGYQDNDGCPDADNDSDGIVDSKDNCPNEAEVFNGYQDNDGCPDELPEPVYVEPEPVVKKAVIKDRKKKTVPPKPKVSNAPSQFLIHVETTFADNSTQIKSSAYSELNKIINELKKYPNTNWRIEGHIDKQASRSEASRITKAQADAILTYFVSKGLPASNFQAIGFGDSTPIASNSSVFGRMKNKRIIIRKVN